MKLDFTTRLTTGQKAVSAIPFLIALIVAPYSAYMGTRGMDVGDKISAHSFFLVAGFIIAGIIAFVIASVFNQNAYFRKRDAAFNDIRAAYGLNIPNDIFRDLMSLRTPTLDFRLPNEHGVLIKYTATFFDGEFRLFDAYGIEELPHATGVRMTLSYGSPLRVGQRALTFVLGAFFASTVTASLRLPLDDGCATLLTSTTSHRITVRDEAGQEYEVRALIDGDQFHLYDLDGNEVAATVNDAIDGRAHAAA